MSKNKMDLKQVSTAREVVFINCAKKVNTHKMMPDWNKTCSVMMLASAMCNVITHKVTNVLSLTR